MIKFNEFLKNNKINFIYKVPLANRKLSHQRKIIRAYVTEISKPKYEFLKYKFDIFLIF